jgi:pimeloyl-ACP methyl ester carboxylesterase
VWGKGDQIFLPPGAEAYKRDPPKAEIHFFDTGHFALEEDASGIADQIIRFYGQQK